MNPQKLSMPMAGALTAAATSLLAIGPAHGATKPAFGAYSLVGAGQQLSGVSGARLQPNGVPSDLVVDLAGTRSFDDQNAPGNTYLSFDLAPGTLIDAFSYSLTLATVGDSWLSEATILLTNSAGDGVAVNPGFNEARTGTMSYSSSLLFSSLGLGFNVGADGKLFVQFYEAFDDAPNAADAFYTAGSMTFGNVGVVPEPATYGLMALGMFAVGASVRRRRC